MGLYKMFKSISNLFIDKELREYRKSIIDSRKYTETLKKRKARLLQSYKDFYDHVEDVINEANIAVDSLEHKLQFMKIKLEVIQQQSTNAIIIESDDCRWIEANVATCQILGIDSKKCIGKNTSDIITLYPELKDFFEQLITLEVECIKEKKPIDSVLDIDESRKLSLRISPITNSDNTYLELVIIGKLL